MNEPLEMLRELWSELHSDGDKIIADRSLAMNVNNLLILPYHLKILKIISLVLAARAHVVSSVEVRCRRHVAALGIL
jgi:hypothetical protein